MAGGPLVNAAGQPYEGASAFSTTSQFKTSGGGVDLDPRILDILQTAAQAFPMKVEAFSGVEGRTSGTTNHPGGFAIDVRLYDQSGTPLANSPADAARRGQNLGDNFRAYESYAQTARDIQMQKYPDLANTFRWGGYFMAGDTPFDLMHFDINPKMGGATGGGTWDTGLSAEARKLIPGANSVGMQDVVRQQLADLGFTGPNAVQSYQKARGLTVDGLIGQQTTARLALDVTPPERIPNPYGMRDVAAAIAKGDSTALSAALDSTMKQVMDAHWAGTPDDQIAKDFNGYLARLSPAEQANLRGNFYASPDMQGDVKSSADKFGFASGKLQQAVNAAFQHSQDIADSLTNGRPTGSATQAEVDQAMARMAAVNPGQTTNSAGQPNLPRLRPTDVAGLISKAPQVSAPVQEPDALGSKGTMFEPGKPMPQTFDTGLERPRLRPGEGGAPAPDMNALLSALGMLVPGMPGMGMGGAAGAPGGAQPPAHAASSGTPASGAFAGLQPRLSPGGPPATGAFAGLQPNLRGAGDDLGSSGTMLFDPNKTYATPTPRLRPGDAAAPAPAATASAAPSAGDMFSKAIADMGAKAWRPGVLASIPSVRDLAATTVPRIPPLAAIDSSAGGDDMGTMGTLWRPGDAMPMTFAEGLPDPRQHLRPGDASVASSSSPSIVPRLIEVAQAMQPQSQDQQQSQYDTSIHGMGAVEDWFMGG